LKVESRYLGLGLKTPRVEALGLKAPGVEALGLKCVDWRRFGLRFVFAREIVRALHLDQTTHGALELE